MVCDQLTDHSPLSLGSQWETYVPSPTPCVSQSPFAPTRPDQTRSPAILPPPPTPSSRQKTRGLKRLTKTKTPQILFLIGLTIIIGPQKTLQFFARRQKAKGTAAFFAGLLLILLRWPLVGFCVELYGILVLFGDFLGTVAAFARNLPVVGPYVGALVDRSGLVRRNAELPV